MKQTWKWSSLAAVAALTAMAMTGINAKPAMAQSGSQQWQGGNGGPSQGQSWNSQQVDSRGRGNYDNPRGGGGSCSNNGYRNGRRHKSSDHGSWQSWNQSHQGQRGRWQSRDPRWKNRGGQNRRGDQGWNGGNSGQDGRGGQGWNGSDQDGRNDQGRNDGGQGQWNGGRH